MSLRCNRCGQEEPHLGDSWCLACSASEAIVGELRSAWGTAGSRSLASDVLVSATRQIRALRRLGIAGAGRGRPSVPEGAVPRASSNQSGAFILSAPTGGTPGAAPTLVVPGYLWTCTVTLSRLADGISLEIV